MTTARNIANTKHGHAPTTGRNGSREYNSWIAMVQRCTKKTHHAYGRYGGAGITVCDRWMSSFECFLADMGPRPDGTSIDRVDGTKGYEPSNCRWATRQEQARNKRTRRLVTVDGETKSIAEWAEATGREAQTICGRLKAGWPTKDAVFADRYAAHKGLIARPNPIGKPRSSRLPTNS